ncbi:hypothetical protein [Fictibacillus nanhaiensis]|uniref:hypothetical protein n=1 Tax=Fictibacillus nanhaiensis TaxID=742169 RepID=UPI003C1E8831
MDLKAGCMYDAIHKTEPNKSVIIKVVECGKVYAQVEIKEINGPVRAGEFINLSRWNFYEIRTGDAPKDEDSLLEIQRLAVELGNKDLFDRCNKDLQELGYGVS